MAEQFDPYRKWLGIPPEEQPPNHYRLLGIALFEDDIDVIAHAADRQMSHVRKFQSGQNGHHSQQILNELAKARVCLLDRGQKIPYDQELHKLLGNGRRASHSPVAAPRVAPVPAPPQPPPQAVPAAVTATLEPPTAPVAPIALPVSPVAAAGGVAGVRPSRTITARARRKASPLPLVLGLCGLGAFIAIGALVAVLASSGLEDEVSVEDTSTRPPILSPPLERASTTPKVEREKPVTKPPRKRNEDRTPSGVKPEFDDSNQPDKLIIPERPENAVDEDAPSLPRISRDPTGEGDPPMDVGDETPDDDAPESEPTDKPTETPPTDETDEPAADDPQRLKDFAAAIAATEDAFAQRDLKEAARQLAAARRLQQGDNEAVQVAALTEIQTHLGTFWRLAATGARKLQPGEEISFGSDEATFDAFVDGDVKLFVAGERLSRPLEELELPYAVALAERGSLKPDSKSRLAIAAFLAVDGNAQTSERQADAKDMLAEAVSLGGRSAALEMRLGEKPAP
jgi:hypothetical protein